MKPSIDLRELLGWIAVVGMLVLSSPGVMIVHAEGEEQALRAAPAPGPVCQAGAETSRATRQAVSVDLSGLVAMRAPGSGTGVVALETGGYGYGEESAAGLEATSGSSAVVPTD
jgi:hypothetical protein